LTDENGVKKIAIFNKNHTKVKIYDKTNRAEDEDLTYSNMNDMFLTQISLAHFLAGNGGFFLHSGGVVINGKGILFVGHSGAGKSTLRNMALLNKKIKPLCNDRNIVRKYPDGYMIHGTWVYTENIQEIQAVSAPLGAIMFLEQAKENLIIPLENKLEITKKLLPCILRPIESTDWWNKTLNIVDELTQEIPCYRLRFDLTGRIVEQLEDLFYRSW
jgi:hypothetical protein